MYRFRESAPTCAVFWVSATSRESFDQGFRAISEGLGGIKNAPHLSDDADAVKKRVKARLSDETYGTWILIVDDADDAETLFDYPAHTDGAGRLVDDLPLSRNGYIIFTTRTRAVALRLAESNVIPLQNLGRADAATLLRRRLLPEHKHQARNQEALDTFLSTLAFLPLAIVQAAAYININGNSLAEYTTLFQDNLVNAVELLREAFESPEALEKSAEIAFAVWLVSRDRIISQDGPAAALFSFMTCVASNEIPVSILARVDTIAASETNEMVILKAYNFVTERQLQASRPDQAQQHYKTFDLDSYAHAANRAWAKVHGHWHDWTTRVMIGLLISLAGGDDDNGDKWTAALPHAIHVATLPGSAPSDMKIILLSRIAHCERALGRFKAAERFCRQALEQRKLLSGKEHGDVELVIQLVRALIDLKRSEEAEALLDDLIDKEEGRIGEGIVEQGRSDLLESSTIEVSRLVSHPESKRHIRRYYWDDGHSRTLRGDHHLSTLLTSRSMSTIHFLTPETFTQ